MTSREPDTASRRLTLAIETSNPSSGGTPGVALGLASRDAVVVLADEPLGGGERHDDLLMPAVARAFERAERQPHELERIVVSIGPGGYTGLRMATAAASSLALVTGAEAVGIPSAWVAAAGHAALEPAGGPFVVALASKGETCWATPFDAAGVPTADGRLCGSDDTGDFGTERWVADRFLPASIRAAVESAGGRVAEPRFEAASLLELGVNAPPAAGSVLTPLYGREAEAVTRWRAARGP